MKKTINKRLFLLLVVLAVLSACGENNPDQSTTGVSTNETGQAEEVADDHIRITISLDHGNQYVNEREVEIADGTHLLEVLETSFFVETNEENEVISIERMAVDEQENTAWVLIVDGVESTIPISEYTLQSGEKITLDLR